MKKKSLTIKTKDNLFQNDNSLCERLFSNLHQLIKHEGMYDSNRASRR